MSDTISVIAGIKQPKPWVLKAATGTNGSNPDLMMGVELEIEHCEVDDEDYGRMVNKLGWAVTTDGSLRGRNIGRAPGMVGEEGYAFEFISKPMTQSTLLYSMEEFFKVTKFNDSNYTDRTSVHVHVNCLDLTYAQLSSVALVYTIVEEILFKFVGQERENNIYCIPWTHCRMNYDIVDRIESDGISVIKRWQKYTAMNLLPLLQHGTVEFRHMHGTADMQKLSVWINLIGAIFKFATTTELSELITEIKKLNSSSEYESFFHRVLGGNLPFNEGYRESLEAGVISAKFGLINWKKGAAKKSSYTAAYADFEEVAAPPVPQAASGRPLRAGGAGRLTNRFVPWPMDGAEFFVTAGDINNLNTAERNTLGDPRLRGLCTMRGSILTVTGQPNPDFGIATVAEARAVRMEASQQAGLAALQSRVQTNTMPTNATIRNAIWSNPNIPAAANIFTDDFVAWDRAFAEPEPTNG